jgi:3-hydroxy-3-methylglutaryl CoA synthase
MEGAGHSYNRFILNAPNGINVDTDPTLDYRLSFFPGSLAKNINLTYGFKGRSDIVSSGCTASADAIGNAFEHIQYDAADVILAGGAEDPINLFTIKAFDVVLALSTRSDIPEKASRPFDRKRSGFVMGEGAAIIVLEELEHAKRRGAHIYCEVAAYQTTCDAFHQTASDPQQQQAARAIREALLAAKAALADAAIAREDIGGLFLGTRTDPYTTRPSSTFLAEALGLSARMFTSDIQVGNRSGVAALISSLALVESAMVSNALALASDTIGRYAAPGSWQGAFAASGAAGFVLAKENVIAEFRQVVSGFGTGRDASEADAVCRPNRIGADSMARVQTAEAALVQDLTAAVKGFFAATHLQPQDFGHAVFPQPYARIAEGVGAALGFEDRQLCRGLVTPEIGDCGGASVLIGLAAVLDAARPGETILLVSYGAGGYDILSLEVTSAMQRKRDQAGALRQHLFADGLAVDYATAMKHEQKYRKVPYELNAFM